MEPASGIAAVTNFSAIDWVIILLYPSISVALGIMCSRFVRDMDDFVVAGRGIRTALGFATLTGTELGLVTVMYNAQVGFTGGFGAFHIGLAAGVVAFFVGISGFIIADLRREEVLTISEYYGKRYGKSVQVVGGLILAFGGIFNMGMFLKAGSIFVVGVTGLPPEGAAVTIVMMVLLTLVLFYTILGGMISVVIADYVQFVVLSLGLLSATAIIIAKVGWNEIFSGMATLRGEAGFNPFMEESSFGWDYVVLMMFMGVVSCALWPTAVSRALAAESPAVVKKQFTLASTSFAIRTIIPIFWGCTAYVLVMKTPDLKALFFPGPVEDPSAGGLDTLFALPIFMGSILPTGLLGLIAAGMIAAFMSTHDSYFLCWSSVLANDVVAPLMGGKLSPKGKVLLTRVFIFLIGVSIFLVSYTFPLKENLWDFLVVTGAIYYSSAFALLVCGLYWKRASKVGAFGALIAGCFSVLGLGGVRDTVFGGLCGLSEATLQQITADRVTLAVVSTSMVLMVLGSLIFPDQPAPAEEI
jgi:solute:Na+ symporter, SSS family